MLIQSRRNFLKAAVTSAGALGAFSKFGEMNALASTSAPYQALVCIYLAGGNDSNNMVIPADPQNYGLYAAARRMLAMPQNKLQMIANGGAAYGLHPLMPEL